MGGFSVNYGNIYDLYLFVNIRYFGSFFLKFICFKIMFIIYIWKYLVCIMLNIIKYNFINVL